MLMAIHKVDFLKTGSNRVIARTGSQHRYDHIEMKRIALLVDDMQGYLAFTPGSSGEAFG